MVLHKVVVFKTFIRSRSVSSTDYCIDLVKRNEHENFLCSLLLPKAVRSAAFAVRAFNIEVSQILDKTKEKDITVGRIKFWEDTLDRIYKDEPPKHPVALELARAVQKHKLLKKQFRRLLTARMNAAQGPVTFPDLRKLEAYTEESNSPVFYLILQAAGIANVDVDHAASHLGKAQGLVNLLRSTPHHASRQSVLLPQELLTKYGITHEDIIRGRSSKGVKDAVFDIASSANIHLAKARSLRVPRLATSYFLPAVPLSRYLDRLRDDDFDIFSESLHQRDVHLGMSLFWRRLFLTY